MKNYLLAEIFNVWDNQRVADARERELVSDLGDARAKLAEKLATETEFCEEYLVCEQTAEAYAERAYFYDGVRAAVQLMRECGVEAVVNCFTADHRR